jgi:hypothetical protein
VWCRFFDIKDGDACAIPAKRSRLAVESAAALLAAVTALQRQGRFQLQPLDHRFDNQPIYAHGRRPVIFADPSGSHLADDTLALFQWRHLRCTWEAMGSDIHEDTSIE